MSKRLRFLSCSVLAAAAVIPAFSGNTVQAADYYGYSSRYSNLYQPGVNYWNTGFTSRRNTVTNSRTSRHSSRRNSRYNNYSYGYNNYGYGYGYGYNNYYLGSNIWDYFYPNYNYNNYGYNYNNYGYNGWNNYNNLVNDENYIYWNGNHYYRMNDGSYRIYRDGEWKPLTNNSNNNSSSNNLENDPHYRYENGYHYYVLENGDYYYYQDGKWVLVKTSTNNSTTPSPQAQPETPSTEQPAEDPKPEVPTPTPAQPEAPTPAPSDKPEEPTTPAEPKPEQPTTPSVDLPENPPINGADSEFDPFNPKPAQPAEDPKPAQPEQPATPGNSGLVTTDESSENQIPDYVEKPAEGLEHLAWAPNGQTPKLVYPPGKPGDKALKNDKNYYFDGSTHYYYVPSNSDRTGYSAYWKWIGQKWKLQGMTDPNDPGIDPKLHNNTADDEYMYSDQNSSVKLYSTNLVTTAKAGQPLPFKNVEEFKKYVIEKMNPKFLDNAGWDAKAEWEIEDADIFEKTKENPYAKDYVLIANLKSGVEDKKYSDVEFGYVKFVYRVEATNDTNYDYVSKAKEAFAKINETRKAQGLKELTWSEDIYQNQALPKVNEISRQYDSAGFVGRRDEDAATVVKKWANSGLRELLLDPNVTEGAVATVVDGNGVYYWTYNYK
ncbi:CAP domain-containing protein [Streptococcus gordonii]|uniref:CAP domain-containing protein n=1 Tax=Streptococcus gordonii TaxID=1302 RepID=UPI001EDEF530|nr:CAP domain-containing protein [Streptococcus gordonii]MCG4823045.1 CAP domain-containing protein [Streptococcus gordonii]MCG4848403.1 CAP domain-containing protein [Streptococcus gordonii]MDE8687178.1 CAP domain-containing protein [Streptococcus gordonii]